MLETGTATAGHPRSGRGRRGWLPTGIAALLLTTACGSDARAPKVTDTHPEPPVPAGPGVVGACAAPTPLRRLTRTEYDNTVRDLLGVSGHPGDALPDDAVHGGFDEDVAGQGASPLLAGGYLRIAEQTATSADLTKLLPCPPDALDDACARAFVEQFGKRAFRRPLRPPEVSTFLGFLTDRRAQYGAEIAARLTVQLFLSSPAFLYRLEPLPAGARDASPLSPYEVATRLSYLFWGSMPDQALFQAADAGQLATKEQIAAQAERLLDDPRGRARVRTFFAQALVLDDLDDVNRDAKRHPGWSDSLPKAMETETLTFTEKLVFDDHGTFADLLTSSTSYMSKPLATYLGVKGPTGSAFEKVMLPAGRASGILTQAGLLAMNSKEDQPHPIYRGRWVRNQLLCQDPPPPPAGLMAQTPKLADDATTRQVFAQHSQDPGCAGCHRLLDPIGFGLEHYDATGKWRDRDRTLPIDSRGELVDAGDASGPFDGAVELGARLASSEAARGCFAKQLFRFASGREEGATDGCTLGAMGQVLARPDGTLQELLVAFTQTDAFVTKSATRGGP